MSKITVLIYVFGMLSIGKSDFILKSLHPDANCAKEPVHYFIFEYGFTCFEFKLTSGIGVGSTLYGKSVITRVNATSWTFEGTGFADDACATIIIPTQARTISLSVCDSLPNGWSASYNYFVERPMLPAEKSYVIDGGYDSAADCTSSNYNHLLVGAAWLLDGCIPIDGGTSVKFTASGNKIYHHSYLVPDCIGASNLDGTDISGSCSVGEVPYEFPAVPYVANKLNRSFYLKAATKAVKGGKGTNPGKVPKAPTPGVTTKAPTKLASKATVAPVPSGKDSKGKQ